MPHTLSTLISPENFQVKILKHFNHEPSMGQDRLFYAFTRFIFSDKPRLALLIKGYAGTGKTTSVSAMVRTLKELNQKVILLAPTGRAAKVLGNYSGHTAWTIHRQIYTRVQESGFSYFSLRENEHENTVFFVDEASMIGTEKIGGMRGDGGSGDLLDDLITYVMNGEGCRLVLIGDAAQLPPIGSDQSPALNLALLQSRYFLNIAELELSEVIRQAEGSGILANATAIRKLITSASAELPHFQLNDYNDIKLVTGDLQGDVEDAFANFGKEDTIIITRSNKRANLFNQQVRARILWHEEEINSSDRMMVLKNNYFWLDGKNPYGAGFIANGDVIVVQRIRKFEERGAFRFARATISMVDYPDMPEFDVILLCNTIWEESASLSQTKLSELGNLIAEDYAHIPNLGQRKRAVYQDEYYNALEVKFAYAITCHKAQGGQWPCVFVDQGYINDEMVGVELNRWFYTAVTRASLELHLVGFDEKLLA
ncbi:MAG: ATP-dependent RecD-like DNA helicase [Flavobacteriales bacterium]